jgi:hypothetical protein
MKKITVVISCIVVFIMTYATTSYVIAHNHLTRDEFNKKHVRVYMNINTKRPYHLVFIGKMTEEEKEINKKAFNK